MNHTWLDCGEDNDNFAVFPNKGLKRSLKQLQVYCTHGKDDCEWRGELGELEQHLQVGKEHPLTVGDIKMRSSGEGEWEWEW